MHRLSRLITVKSLMTWPLTHMYVCIHACVYTHMYIQYLWTYIRYTYNKYVRNVSPHDVNITWAQWSATSNSGKGEGISPSLLHLQYKYPSFFIIFFLCPSFLPFYSISFYIKEIRKKFLWLSCYRLIKILHIVSENYHV